MSEIKTPLGELLLNIGMDLTSAQLTAQLLTIFITILIAFFAHSIARGPLLRAIQKIVAKN